DPDVDLCRAPPREVARRLAEGECDGALIPVAAAATIGDIELLDLGIVARGPVRSVVIAAKSPIEDLRTVMLDASSRTSVVLTRLTLRRPGIAAPPHEVIASIDGDVGGLIIGDPALEVEGRFPYVLDLGEAWNSRTGLPFVFAAWATRRGGMSEALVARLRRAAREVIAAREELATAYARARKHGP